MRRAQVRKIFDQHKGERARLAKQLDVTLPSIGDVLAGRKQSARILEAATERALEIQAEEEGQVKEAQRVPA